MEYNKNFEKIKKLYPPYWVSDVCKSLRGRHKNIDKKLNSKHTPKPRTWKLCIEYNAQKLRRFHAKDGRKRKENNQPWNAFVTYQKEKLSRKFDENSLWKRLENRILKKINAHNFPKEKGTLWNYCYHRQIRKLKNIHPDLRERPSDYKERFANRQMEKLKFLYNKKKPENEEWKFWWLAQLRKLHARYKGVLGVNNKNKFKENPKWH